MSQKPYRSPFTLVTTIAVAAVATLWPAAAFPKSSTTLLAHWTLDSGAQDVTGNGHDGTIFEAVAAEGHFGGSLAFDGVDDHVGIPQVPLLATVTAGAHSIAAWVFLDRDTGGNYKMIVDASEPAAVFNTGDQRGLRLDDRGFVVFKWVTTSNSFHAFSDSALSVERWHHLVGTFDGVQGALYVDGVLQDVATSTGTPTTASVWDIGDVSAGGQGTHYFPGRIDDVRVYSGALTAEQVMLLFSPETVDVCALFNQDKAWPGGTVPVRLRLCADDGTNLSAATTVVRAVSLLRDGLATEPTDAGSANPGNVFRFVDNSYIFNLNTKDLAPGTYELLLEADGRQLARSLSLRIK